MRMGKLTLREKDKKMIKSNGIKFLRRQAINTWQEKKSNKNSLSEFKNNPV